MKAWLITWESIGDHAAVANPSAAVLSPRLTARRVLEYVRPSKAFGAVFNP